MFLTLKFVLICLTNVPIKIAEKDDIIDEYESELARFKCHYSELLERQEKIFALGPIDPERHLFLKENAEIVLVKILIT